MSNFCGNQRSRASAIKGGGASSSTAVVITSSAEILAGNEFQRVGEDCWTSDSVSHSWRHSWIVENIHDRPNTIGRSHNSANIRTPEMARGSPGSNDCGATVDVRTYIKLVSSRHPSSHRGTCR